MYGYVDLERYHCSYTRTFVHVFNMKMYLQFYALWVIFADQLEVKIQLLYTCNVVKYSLVFPFPLKTLCTRVLQTVWFSFRHDTCIS